ncbi:MAG TPA: hypothetical protein VI306_08095 [Pyrinomonadaceae bacterium]
MKNDSPMFDKYGPNALKVSAFIGALKRLSANEFALRGPWFVDQKRLDAFLQKVGDLQGERVVERANAYIDSQAALEGKDSEIHREVAASVAKWIVLEDHLTREERNFLFLALVDSIVELKVLYAGFKKEDQAIEDFCEQWSHIDEGKTYIKCRPDSRGQSGEGLPDFILCRGEKDFTIEHTFVNTYRKQVFYELLWARYIKSASIEERIRLAYPEGRISVYIPMDTFKRESQARDFDFAEFKQKLIDSIEKTPKGMYGSKRQTHNLPFPVVISNDDPMGFPGCYVIAIAPTDEERIETNLEEEIRRAILNKRKKLHEASKRGESTILLLDSDDYAFVNYQLLADAFAKVAGADTSTLEGIDDVYIQHRGGRCWIVPVKLGSRVYPNLAEFDEYCRRQRELLSIFLG